MVVFPVSILMDSEWLSALEATLPDIWIDLVQVHRSNCIVKLEMRIRYPLAIFAAGKFGKFIWAKNNVDPIGSSVRKFAWKSCQRSTKYSNNIMFAKSYQRYAKNTVLIIVHTCQSGCENSILTIVIDPYGKYMFRQQSVFIYYTPYEKLKVGGQLVATMI